MYSEKNIKRMSCFYVNEVHLITMLLPYIERKVNENCKMYTYLQNGLEKTVNILLAKLNLKLELKEKIKLIKWNKNENTDYNEIIKKITKKDKKIYILVSGNEDYIIKINRNFNRYKKNNKNEELVIINCYDIVNFNKNIIKILKNTDKIINTSGEHEVEEIFPEYKKMKKMHKVK